MYIFLQIRNNMYIKWQLMYKKMKNFVKRVDNLIFLLYNPDFDSFERVKTPYALFYKGLESFLYVKKMRTIFLL